MEESFKIYQKSFAHSNVSRKYHSLLDSPETIDSIVWNDSQKKWFTERITVEEYHGFTECRRCQKPLSHNVKTSGKFKIIYVRCGCR